MNICRANIRNYPDGTIRKHKKKEPDRNISYGKYIDFGKNR